MKNKERKLTSEEIAAAKHRRLEAMRMQEIVCNPLDAEQIAMFEMFEREGWSHERRIDYVRQRHLVNADDAE